MEFLNNVEDFNSRRRLVDWDVNLFCKSVKLLTIAEYSTVGGHFHKEKDELFILITGLIDELVMGEEVKLNVVAPAAWLVKRGTYHKFYCKSSASLICLATETFDTNDDYK